MSHQSNNERDIVLRIRRQDTPDGEARWEEFSIPYRPHMNIIACLQYIAAHPVTTDGKATAPVVYDSNCLEEVCGACTMLINGRTRQACSALVDQLEPTYRRQTGDDDSPVFNSVNYGPVAAAEPRSGHASRQVITLEPMSKFPLVRDLFVDRSRLFRDLERAKCWVPIDGTHDIGPGPEVSQESQEERYALSRCISCGCCLEACPQYTPTNQFVGAAVFSQVKLFNAHPTGAALKDERLDAMSQPGGIADCSKAGNCVVVCPKDIPNLESIATVGRQTFLHAIKEFFGG
jgi:succinate dehydrogenase / fumarate reductase iron-sulfur subunit